MTETSVITEVEIVRDFLRRPRAARRRRRARVARRRDRVPERAAASGPRPQRGREAAPRDGPLRERVRGAHAQHRVERTDRAHGAHGRARRRTGGGLFWVCGTFEVRNGRIVLWRDYFDYANFVWAFVKGTFRALLGRR